MYQSSLRITLIQSVWNVWVHRKEGEFIGNKQTNKLSDIHTRIHALNFMFMFMFIKQKGLTTTHIA